MCMLDCTLSIDRGHVLHHPDGWRGISLTLLNRKAVEVSPPWNAEFEFDGNIGTAIVSSSIQVFAKFQTRSHEQTCRHRRSLQC